MKRFLVPILITLVTACVASAQFGGTSNWDAWGGGPQRSGWQKNDNWLTKENAKDIRLIWKRKLDNGRGGTHALLPPVIEGGIISYAGIRELVIVAGRSGEIWAIQADFNRTFWTRQLDRATEVDAPGACPGGITATPAMMPLSIFGGGGYHRPKPGSIRQQPIYAVSGDGMLHRLNPSTGADLFPPVHFLPAHAKASNLAAINDVIYTTTSDSCGNAPNGVWAIDMSGDPAAVTGKVASFTTEGGQPVGLGGAVVSSDGTVYVQTSDGKVDALTAKVLHLKGSFSIPGGAAPVTPAVFNVNGHGYIVSASKNGRLYLLDSQSFGGSDPTALDQTEPLSSAGVSGAFATWVDPESGTPWIFAPVQGSVQGANAPDGAIVAFKVEEQNGKPALKRAWVSPISSPVTPVLSKGIVFALAPGENSHATLYALDAATGKQLYSTGDQITAPGALTGITVANGRVYVPTTDNTLWQIGIQIEH